MTTAMATRTSCKNINSRYCDHFATIPNFLIWQRCGSPSEMKPLRAAVNLGEKHENLCPSADGLHNTSNLVISRCSFADDGKEIDKKEKRTCRACKATAFAYYSLIGSFSNDYGDGND